jgi:hypothetical protein
VQKDASGKWFILYHHTGAINSHETYLRKIREALKGDLEGVEPGYKVPQTLFKTLKRTYPDESFEKKRILLYFPSRTTFSLDGDIRNTASQMKVLLSLIGEQNLAIVITGFLNQMFHREELETLKKVSHIYLIEDTMGILLSLFNVSENPLICFVNDSGRIVFRSDSLTPARAEALLKGKSSRLSPNLTDSELLDMMQNSMKKISNKIEKVTVRELESGEKIYLGFSDPAKGEASLFGIVVSKYSICDVCHDIHYYYILDQNGHIVALEIIYATKYGNVYLSEKDIEKLRSRTVGKDAFKNIEFDPYLDAVSQATMSSYLIFDGLNDAKSILAHFKDNGFRREYWREICLDNLCAIKEVITLLDENEASKSITLEDQVSLDIEKLR